MAQLIDNLLEMVRTQVKAKRHHLKVRVHDIRHENVIGDSLRIQQVFVNLMSNAIKYTPEGGSICISVRPWQFYTRIDVADTGMGIPAAHYHDVFKRFYRAQPSAAAEGVGLGLYLAQGIISRQKGYISVKSEVGKGSTFSVFLLR